MLLFLFWLFGFATGFSATAAVHFYLQRKRWEAISAILESGRQPDFWDFHKKFGGSFQL